MKCVLQGFALAVICSSVPVSSCSTLGVLSIASFFPLSQSCANLAGHLDQEHTFKANLVPFPSTFAPLAGYQRVVIALSPGEATSCKPML